MNSDVQQLRDEYHEEVRLFVWYMPSKHTFFQGKANQAKAEQHRIAAQIAWLLYQEKKGK